MTVGEMIAYAISAITVGGTILYNRRKADIDESAVILGAWKNLFDEHKLQMTAQAVAHKAAMAEALTEYERKMGEALSEISALRQKITAHEKRITALETENTALREENAGLKRSIAQNSQSSAMLIGDISSRARSIDIRHAASADRGKASEGRVSGMEDEISRLDRSGGNSRGRKP